MDIQLKKVITEIVVITFPNWKNNFNDPSTKTLLLPDEFYEGKDWIITHNCSNCNNNTTTEKSKINRIGRLSKNYIENVKILMALGSMFHLKLKNEIDENNFEIFNYSLTGKYKDIAGIAYYRCQHCSAQYLLAYCDIDGDDDRHPEPDKVYIEKILQVEFDQEEFMAELKKG